LAVSSLARKPNPGERQTSPLIYTDDTDQEWGGTLKSTPFWDDLECSGISGEGEGAKIGSSGDRRDRKAKTSSLIYTDDADQEWEETELP
jgi:hypothetical protein